MLRHLRANNDGGWTTGIGVHPGIKSKGVSEPIQTTCRRALRFLIDFDWFQLSARNKSFQFFHSLELMLFGRMRVAQDHLDSRVT